MATSKTAAKKPAKTQIKQGTSQRASEARKEKFIEAYIANGGNGTQAAVVAGYSPKTANEQASRLLADVNLQTLLKRRQTILASKFSLRTEDVLRELARIVYADPRKAFDEKGNLLPVHEWPDEVAAMIASVESDEIFEGSGAERVCIGHTKKVKLWDKNSAIDKAMKHLGQYEQDNLQKGPFADMTPDALDRFIARKAAETGSKLH